MLLSIQKKEIVDRNFIKDGTEEKIEIPYGVAVNPVTKEIFVTDAKDYVTPGRLYCYSPKENSNGRSLPAIYLPISLLLIKNYNLLIIKSMNKQ